MVVQQAAAFEFRCYRRPFSMPLQTHHGFWQWRQGIILRLADAKGQQSFGEIAPMPWFGTETLEAAIDWCQQQQGILSADQVRQIPPTLPACQFGFESAWAGLYTKIRSKPLFALPNSALLPAGEMALETWRSYWQKGVQTFKWKIGVQEFSTETSLFQRLVQLLPTTACLRLDANGGLTLPEATRWLEYCDQLGRVEYLEQPLPPSQFTPMQQLSRDYATPLALDESISTVTQLQQCYDQGWQGIAVIKPAIAGFPSRLRQVCQKYEVDAVFSSVFETAIGHQAGLALAAELMCPKRAVGFGTNHWFDPMDPLSQGTGEAVWQYLARS